MEPVASSPSMPRIFLVSACLVGLRSRYDGATRPSAECLAALDGAIWLPFCPEQLGGLTTPREPADLTGGDGADVLAGRALVLTRNGLDVTAQFIRGAEETLALARMQRVAGIFLKARSPSCGLAPLGVAAALLREHGFLLREF